MYYQWHFLSNNVNKQHIFRSLSHGFIFIPLERSTSDRIRPRDERIVRRGSWWEKYWLRQWQCLLKGPASHGSPTCEPLNTCGSLCNHLYLYSATRVSNSNPLAYLNSRSNSENPGSHQLPAIDLAVPCQWTRRAASESCIRTCRGNCFMSQSPAFMCRFFAFGLSNSTHFRSYLGQELPQSPAISFGKLASDICNALGSSVMVCILSWDSPIFKMIFFF